MSRVDANPIGIIELGDACGLMRARSLDLFEQLGAAVAVTDDPALQRLFATACHRHAWHAELWADRCPAIPDVDLDALVARHRGVDLGDPVDVETYRGVLDEMIAEVEALDGRLDPELDPATERTLTLVANDLHGLHDRLG